MNLCYIKLVKGLLAWSHLFNSAFILFFVESHIKRYMMEIDEIQKKHKTHTFSLPCGRTKNIYFL